MPLVVVTRIMITLEHAKKKKKEGTGVCGDVLMFTWKSCDFQPYMEGAMDPGVKVPMKERIR